MIALASLALPVAQAVAQPNAAQRALERRLGPQAVVDIDAETGTPRVLARLDGTLTGARRGDPEDIALDYVRRNLDALGLTESDLDTLEGPETTTVGGITEVRWRQAVDGIPSTDSELRVNLTRDGRVLNVLGSPKSGLDPDTTPSVSAAEAVKEVQEAAGVRRSLALAGTDTELVLFKGRLAWQVVYPATSTEVYNALVDAETGRVLRKHNLVKSAVNVEVWERFPNGPREIVDIEKYLDPGATTLSGRWVRAFSDLDDDDALDAGEDITPAAHAFTQFDGAGCGPTRLCSWAFGTAGSWQTNRAQNGVQAFYLANRFAEHLRQPPINFNGFQDEDRLILHTNDGAATGPDAAHLNNANMLTWPEGQSPRMQMYLWGGTRFRSVNSGDDASILFHEYTHGLTSRLVVEPVNGFGALNTPQAGAMGEGWGDWYAKDFLVGEGLEPDNPSVPGEVDMGVYTDRIAHQVRNQPIDCPVGASAAACPASGTAGSGGYTYGDFGKVDGVPSVHGDGEIWAQTLWDLRSAIGPVHARRLITNAMRLSPPEPSFLDMRNAILQADQAEGAPRRAQIWQVFARRGMGFFAATADSTDLSPLEDFSLPPAPGGPRGTISGRVTDTATGQPVEGVSAAVGGLVDGPDKVSDTTGADGRFAIANAPAASYPSFVFKKPGYDTLVGPIRVPGGGSTALTATLRRNWAALASGSSFTGDNTYASLGCGVRAALDQNPGSGWSTDRDGTPSSMTVTLAEPVDVHSFGVDPTAACGDGDAAATRQILIETSPSTSANDWTEAAFQSLPFTEDHTVRQITPTAGTQNVRRVRVTLHSNWGDPDFIDISEFMVYSGPPAEVTATVTEPPPGPAPTVVPPTPTATPAPAPVITGPEPTPAPTATPPPPSPARPSFTLPRSAKYTKLRVKVNCRADCRVTAKLVVARSVARRLGLGRSRTAATITRNLAAGNRTLTLKLKSKAARALRSRKVRSFRGTLRISAAYAGDTARTSSRQVTVKR